MDKRINIHELHSSSTLPNFPLTNPIDFIIFGLRRVKSILQSFDEVLLIKTLFKIPLEFFLNDYT